MISQIKLKDISDASVEYEEHENISSVSVFSDGKLVMENIFLFSENALSRYREIISKTEEEELNLEDL